ncbi:MAG: hypothetical protein ACKO3S_05270, partial [bacterium]
LMSINFLLSESLGGGGTVSLRMDPQGKTLSHALLTMPVRVPAGLVTAAERGDAEHRRALGKREARPARSTAPRRRRASKR